MNYGDIQYATKTSGSLQLREHRILNYVNFFACILLAFDWFKNNQLLSQLTHAHYCDTVPVNPPLSNRCQKGQKATTLSMLNLSSRFKPPKNSTWPCLSGNPPHFIHEMKTKVYDAIDFYEFLPSLWDSCPQKSLIGAPYSTLETRLAHFPYVIRETSSLSNLLSSLVEFW